MAGSVSWEGWYRSCQQETDSITQIHSSVYSLQLDLQALYFVPISSQEREPCFVIVGFRIETRLNFYPSGCYAINT